MKLKKKSNLERKILNLQKFGGNVATYVDMEEIIGLTPEVALVGMPLLNVMCNMEYESAIGDTIVFNSLDLSSFENDIDVVGTPGGNVCAPSEIVCGDLGYNKIEIDLSRRYRKTYPLDKCEIAKMEALGREESTGLLNKVKGKIDMEHMKAELDVALKTDLLPKLDVIDTGLIPIGLETPSNVWEENQAAILHMEQENPEVDASNYVMLVTKSQYRKNHLYLKGKCCDYLTGTVAVRDEAFAEYDIIVVPDKYLKVGTEQYDTAIYLKKFFIYWFRCFMQEYSEGTNDYYGFVMYQIGKKWQTAYTNFQPNYVNSMGIIYKSAFGSLGLGTKVTPVARGANEVL